MENFAMRKQNLVESNVKLNPVSLYRFTFPILLFHPSTSKTCMSTFSHYEENMRRSITLKPCEHLRDRQRCSHTSPAVSPSLNQHVNLNIKIIKGKTEGRKPDLHTNLVPFSFCNQIFFLALAQWHAGS